MLCFASQCIRNLAGHIFRGKFAKLTLETLSYKLPQAPKFQVLLVIYLCKKSADLRPSSGLPAERISFSSLELLTARSAHDFDLIIFISEIARVKIFSQNAISWTDFGNKVQRIWYLVTKAEGLNVQSNYKTQGREPRCPNFLRSAFRFFTIR